MYYICLPTNGWAKTACTSHKIEVRDLYNLILKDIQDLAKTVLEDADAFYHRLSSRMERQYLADFPRCKKSVSVWKPEIGKLMIFF